MRHQLAPAPWKGLLALVLITLLPIKVLGQAEKAPVYVGLNVMDGDTETANMDITGTKMRFTPWPVNANNLADQWPVVNFGSACHNSSFPTLAYSDLNNDFLRTRGSRYVAVIYRHLEVASACFMNNKYDYAFTNLPAGITKPSAVVVWGPFDPFNGQVTSKYGSGLPQWTPEVALMYIGGEDIFPNLMQLFGPTKLGFQTNDSLSLNGTAVTGYPYMTFVIGPEPVIIYNTRPVEPSAIVGPLIIGLLCVSCGLCNYGLFRLKKRYFSGPMTVSNFGRNFAHIFYQKPPAELTEEEVDVIFPKCDIETSGDCTICLSTMALPPPEGIVDLETAKNAIERAAGNNMDAYASVTAINAADAQQSDAESTKNPVSVADTLATPANVTSDATSVTINEDAASTTKKNQLRCFPTCSHVFHSDCIWGWVESKRKATQFGTVEVRWTCPVCRADHPLWLEAHPEEGKQEPEGESVELNVLDAAGTAETQTEQNITAAVDTPSNADLEQGFRTDKA